MQTAATGGQGGSAGSGRRALAESARTLPGVSAPSKVVRSTIRMARSIAWALAVVFTDRVPSVAVLASTPTLSTPGSPCRNVRRLAGESGRPDSLDVAVAVMRTILRGAPTVDLDWPVG